MSQTTRTPDQGFFLVDFSNRLCWLTEVHLLNDKEVSGILNTGVRVKPRSKTLFRPTPREAWNKRCAELKAQLVDMRARLCTKLRTEHWMERSPRIKVKALKKFKEKLFDQLLDCVALESSYAQATDERDNQV